MGWDWDTSGETAWMTAVNLGYGLMPETQQTDRQHVLMHFNKPSKQCRLEHGEPTVSCQCNFRLFVENKANSFPNTSYLFSVKDVTRNESVSSSKI